MNWSNLARRSDYAAIDRFHELRDKNRTLASIAKTLEKDEPNAAAFIYAKAIEAIESYAFIRFELGLVGELLDEETEEFGFSGDLAILDRFTLTLLKIGEVAMAQRAVEEYFSKYKRDRGLSMAPKIRARVDKASRKSGLAQP